MPEPVYFLPKWTSPEVLHALRNARAARGRVNKSTVCIIKSILSHTGRGAPQELVHTCVSLARGSALFGALSRAHPRARERTKRRQRRPRHHAHHRRRTAVNLCTPPLNIYSAPCQPIHGIVRAHRNEEEGPRAPPHPPAGSSSRRQQPAGRLHSSRPAACTAAGRPTSAAAALPAACGSPAGPGPRASCPRYESWSPPYRGARGSGRSTSSRSREGGC
jgi:hypothetical protein